MNVTFYNFSKRANSTAVPSSGVTIDCAMRSGFATQSPQIEVRSSNVTGYNYMYIADTGRYYYINECAFNAEENFFLVTGAVDVLGTYRAQILASTQQVLRWSGSTDNTIVDTLAPVKSQPFVRTPQNVQFPLPLARSFSNSSVVMSIAGSGRVCMSGATYNALMNNFMTRSDPWDLGQYFSYDVARLLNNPSSYITDVICIPLACNGNVPVMANAGSAFDLIFGWYKPLSGGSPIQAYRVAFNYEHFEDVIGVGAHPDATSVDDFLNYPPYTDVKIYVSGIGLIGLDTNKLSGAENLRVQTTLDYVTGGVTVRVKKESSNTVIGYATGQLGYSLATTQVHSADALGMAGSVVMGTITGGIFGGPLGAGLGAASGVAGAASSLGNNAGVTVHGSNGGAGGWYDYNGQFISVMETYKRIIKPSASRCGVPYNRQAKLDDLGAGAFVQCLTGAVQCRGTEAEKIKIENYLKGGVYLE